MKRQKILAFILTVAFLITQFSALSIVSVTALTGRSDFSLGVNIHPSKSFAAYAQTYSALMSAKGLGSKIIRVGGDPSDEAAYSYYYDLFETAVSEGMQVMFVTKAGGFKDYANSSDVSAVTSYYTNLATRYKGKVKYYQLGNEMDNAFLTNSSSSGTDKTDYSSVTNLVRAINAAYDAIKSVDTNANVVVNFNWTHYGFIKKLIDSSPKAKFDNIGFDWYYPGSSYSQTYSTTINALSSYYNDRPIIVCEANLTPTSTGWNASNPANVTYNGNASWLSNFATYCYNNSHVVGFIAYEMYDEPALLGGNNNDQFNREAFYGLIDMNGNKRSSYTTLQGLYGGTDVDRSISATPSRNNSAEYKFSFKNDPVYGTLPVKFNSNDIVSYTRDGNTYDFTNGDFVEFDLYIEDAVTLKKVMDRYDITLRIKLSDNSGNTIECRHLTSDYIVSSG